MSRIRTNLINAHVRVTDIWPANTSAIYIPYKLAYNGYALALIIMVMHAYMNISIHFVRARAEVSNSIRRIG